MFISTVGTAGGVKTVTIAVIVAAAIASIRNKEEADMFDRRLSKKAVIKALSVVGMSFTIMFASTVALSTIINANTIDIVYETASATATVGLTRNLTSSLNTIGKIIIILTMYFGRVGPISLAASFSKKKENHHLIINPTEEISV